MKVFLKHFWAFAALLFLVTACESDRGSKIPETMTAGAVPNVNLSIEPQESKKLIWAYGSVPFDIAREQVRPTLFVAIKVLKKNYPNYDRFIVMLGPDQNMAKDAFTVGKADYQKDIVKIAYGIPSDKNIAEWNKEAEKSLKLSRPTAELFGKIRQVWASYKRNYEKNPGYHSEQVRGLVCKELGLAAKEVEFYHNFLFHYYSNGTWGTETINLNEIHSAGF